MQNQDNKLKDYWDKTDYTVAWNSKGREFMNNKELKFISKFISNESNNILDVGVGTGRIINSYSTKFNNLNIYGLDISQKMVNYCLERFKTYSQVKKIQQTDISKQEVPFKQKFSLISAVRVFQYNKNWKEITLKLLSSLADNGILIFSCLNRNSINSFRITNPINTYRVSIKEIKTFANLNNLEILELRTFSRLPDIFYALNNNRFYLTLINIIETFIEIIFGKSYLGRILFVAMKKKD